MLAAWCSSAAAWARTPGSFPRAASACNESPEQAMYRELREEIGLRPEDVAVLGSTPDWLRYRLPEQYVRRRMRPLCIGQKQRWFLLRLLSAESRLRLDTTSHARIRPLALGGLLAAPARSDLLQARRLSAGTAAARADRLSRGPAAAARRWRCRWRGGRWLSAVAAGAEPAQDVLAAVDLGSNSFHMVVARFAHGQLTVIDRLREMVRLASGLDTETG